MDNSPGYNLLAQVLTTAAAMMHGTTTSRSDLTTTSPAPIPFAAQPSAVRPQRKRRRRRARRRMNQTSTQPTASTPSTEMAASPSTPSTPSTSAAPSTSSTQTSASVVVLDKEGHIMHLHRILRDMADDKRHGRLLQFNRNLTVVKDIASRHAHIRDELRRGVIRPAPEDLGLPSSKRRRF